MRERILVVGLGRLGMSLIENLVNKDVEVIAVDENMEKVNIVKNMVSHCVAGDSTDIEFLRQIGAEKVDRALLCMGEDFESSILTVTLLVELGVKMISARAANARNAKILERVGAHEIFFVEHEMGKIIASRLTYPAVKKEMEIGYGLRLVDWEAATWAHKKSLVDLQFPAKFGVQIVALFNPDDPHKIIIPQSSTILQEGWRCLLIGTLEAIEAVLKAKP